MAAAGFEQAGSGVGQARKSKFQTNGQLGSCAVKRHIVLLVADVTVSEVDIADVGSTVLGENYYLMPATANFVNTEDVGL